jgi:DNA repair protein RecN (Recombination protein N)
MESEYFSLDNIYNAYKALDDIRDYDKEYMEQADIIFDAYSNLTEAKSTIYKAIDSLDFDEDELNRLQDDLKAIEDCKAKYKKNLDELIKELEDIKMEIALNEDFDSVIEDKNKKLSKLYDEVFDKAKALSNIRRKNAKLIEESIVNECKDLDLKDCSFKIEFNEVEKKDIMDNSIFLDNGIDSVCFMISLNKGEPLKPLHKTASGGELSRIMLAFKSYFAKKAKLSLMVFDEIDTGVSGNAAQEIAKKMKSISKYSQVLCITHLPAVAAKADNQLLISKTYKDGRTTTQIKSLTEDERVEEIAKMIGGNTLSSHFIEVAKEMLKQ